ncbi:xylulokinase [Pseudomonas aeruginosa]|uniref:xylulokinase n=1 Tax=Pseudomonas aeruginosa TaxID=287 RepID=UPI0023AF61CD|nr:xylulokinase [Pseudomonas aeruginosa]MDE8656188.1 xylulokinase [Pseudomonas aeruginosa]
MTPEGRMHGLFLGIDCGTQGSKALLLDAGSGRTLGLGSAAQRPPEGRDGRREQDPADWLEAMASAVRMALEEAAVDGREVRALAVSAQQHGLLLLDAEGRALRPAKLWCDTESAAENRELLEALGGPAGSLERLGLVLAPGYTLSKLLWSRRRFPELFARVAHILLPHDYLNHWLTGRVCSEAGDASGSGYFDVRRRTWASDVLELVEPGGRLAAALPELIEPGACIGNLRPEAAAALGLAPHTRVACGGGDNMLAAIGTGNSRHGLLTASLGTSGTLSAYAERPLVSPHGELATFCASSGGWLPLACTMNLTGACGLVQDLLHLDLDEFSRLAAQAPVGAEGLLMLPFFDGERVPALPHASASLHGMTAANLSRANLCRAVLEGTAFGLRYGLDLLRASGLPGEEIRLVGGAAKNPLWRRTLADLLGLPLVCPRQTEAAALGAALQAAWSLGRESGAGESLEALCRRCVALDESTRTQPQARQQAAYEQAYRRYLELLPPR